MTFYADMSAALVVMMEGAVSAEKPPPTAEASQSSPRQENAAGAPPTLKQRDLAGIRHTGEGPQSLQLVDMGLG